MYVLHRSYSACHLHLIKTSLGEFFVSLSLSSIYFATKTLRFTKHYSYNAVNQEVIENVKTYETFLS